MSADTNLASRLSSRPLIAPAWHTIVFVSIFVGLSVVGGFFQLTSDRVFQWMTLSR
jgi:hypothetical protein